MNGPCQPTAPGARSPRSGRICSQAAWVPLAGSLVPTLDRVKGPRRFPLIHPNLGLLWTLPKVIQGQWNWLSALYSCL